MTSDSDSAVVLGPNAFQRVREATDRETVAELIERRSSEGWSLVAVEWQRETSSEEQGRLHSTEIPYGLQVAQDFLHLIENPLEVEAMIIVLDNMVEDRSLSETAAALNERGLRNRQNEFWTQSQVFDLMPRIVEAAPGIFGTADWRELRRERKRRQLKAV